MDIEEWRDSFEQAWKSQDVESVLDLFTDDVDYYETPSEKLENKEQLREEWQTVKDQQDIEIETEVFSGDGDRFTVKWSLSYTRSGEENSLKGIYLIKLNSDNKCYEFWQYCQLE